MPRTATVLRFPVRRREARQLSADEARSAASRYLETAASERTEGFVFQSLSQPDVILALHGMLYELRSAVPAKVLDESSQLYAFLLGADRRVGIFDEHHYFLGQAALLAGITSRLVGRRDEADIWLDRADLAYRETVNPAPGLANVAYARLTLHFDRRNYGRVLEFVPSLISSFRKLGMNRETINGLILEAMSLKDLSRNQEARTRFESILDEPSLSAEPVLHGMVLMNLGELTSAEGEYADAVALLSRAQVLLQGNKDQAFAMAHLKSILGETLRHQGVLPAAVEAYRAAIGDYATLGMNTWVAYLRVVLSETLIALSRSREAEWEILSALPMIEEQKMVPEGFAAVALLKESVRRRKTDPNALRELREHLQASK